MYVAHERRAYILRLLEQHGHLRSAELARDLGVTDETIRTDLVYLQGQGLLQRVHGGARHILPTGKTENGVGGPDATMADRLAQRIPPGTCLYLDACPFSLMLAWRLKATACKLAMASARLLLQCHAKALPHRLFCPGGELGRVNGLFPADAAGAFLRETGVEMAILRPDVVTPDGISYTDPGRAAWAETAIRCAGKIFLAVPADRLAEQAEGLIPCRPELILTGGNLPEEWEAQPNVETVPYVSRESLLPPEGFDY